MIPGALPGVGAILLGVEKTGSKQICLVIGRHWLIDDARTPEERIARIAGGLHDAEVIGGQSVRALDVHDAVGERLVFAREHLAGWA